MVCINNNNNNNICSITWQKLKYTWSHCKSSSSIPSKTFSYVASLLLLLLPIDTLPEGQTLTVNLTVPPWPFMTGEIIGMGKARPGVIPKCGWNVALDCPDPTSPCTRLPVRMLEATCFCCIATLSYCLSAFVDLWYVTSWMTFQVRCSERAVSLLKLEDCGWYSYHLVLPHCTFSSPLHSTHVCPLVVTSTKGYHLWTSQEAYTRICQLLWPSLEVYWGTSQGGRLDNADQHLDSETSLLSTWSWKNPPFLFFEPCSV